MQEKKPCISVVRFAFWNTRGMAHLTAREKIVHYMKKNRLEILILAETHINTNSREQHDDYIFTFSTNITDEQRAKAEKQKESNKRTAVGQEALSIEIYNIAAEKLGMAIIYDKRINASVKDIISIVLEGTIGEVTITGTHAPHADAEENQKIAYYDALDKYIKNMENNPTRTSWQETLTPESSKEAKRKKTS